MHLALINCRNTTVRDLVLSSNGQGILLQGGEGNTLLNNTLVHNVIGLEAISSNRNEFRDNTLSDNGLGLWLIDSNLNTVANNELRNNTRAILGNLPSGTGLIYGRLSFSYGWSSGALNLKQASSNTIIGNTMVDSDFGVFLAGCGNNTLRNNTMIGNTFNFAIYALRFSQFVHNIDDSNTVDGKPIIYWVNEHGRQVPENAGCATIVNSSDITIGNLDISNNLHGILVVSSSNSLINGNNIANCSSGITVLQSYEQISSEPYPSTNITVRDNTIAGSGVGILLHSGEGHTASCNDLYCNLAGIHVRAAQCSMTSGNTVTNSTSVSLDWHVRLDPRRAGTLDAWSWYSPVVYVGPVGICIESSNNLVVKNTIGNNSIGMTVGLMARRGNNTIYHNNLINNTLFQLVIGSLNSWDNGYPSGGNYWSDYTGEDVYSGPYQNETGSDRIGDTPYLLAKWTDPDVPPEWRTQKDNYPLMEPWTPLPGTIDELKTEIEELGSC